MSKVSTGRSSSMNRQSAMPGIVTKFVLESRFQRKRFIRSRSEPWSGTYCTGIPSAGKFVTVGAAGTQFEFPQKALLEIVAL